MNSHFDSSVAHAKFGDKMMTNSGCVQSNFKYVPTCNFNEIDTPVELRRALSKPNEKLAMLIFGAKSQANLVEVRGGSEITNRSWKCS